MLNRNGFFPIVIEKIEKGGLVNPAIHGCRNTRRDHQLLPFIPYEEDLYRSFKLTCPIHSKELHLQI